MCIWSSIFPAYCCNEWAVLEHAYCLIKNKCRTSLPSCKILEFIVLRLFWTFWTVLFGMFTKFYALIVSIQMCFTREAFKLERASQRSAELDCHSFRVDSMKIVLWTFTVVCSLLLRKPSCHLSLFYLSPSLFQKSLPFLFVKPQSIFRFLYADTHRHCNKMVSDLLTCHVGCCYHGRSLFFWVWGLTLLLEV